jgi:hypothetical protein
MKHVATALAVVLIVVPTVLQFMGDRGSGWLGVDFRAYYCGALAQRSGENPYLAQSLHACEAGPVATYYHAPNNVTVPAPYPPYALALLAPLTFVPFGAAIWLWWMLLAACVLAASYALAQIAGQPFAVGLAALGLSLGLTSFSAGNMMPLGCAAVVLAAWALHRGKIAWGVAALAVAMLEPQIALPAAIGCFVLYRQSRVGLGAIIALFAALSVVTAGLNVTLGYVTTVVPAHALSEVSRDNQYSLATIAGALGVPDTSAALLGSLSYIAMTAIGVIVGVRLWRRFEEPALAVLVPPAFSLLGGSFVHTAEIAAAVPAALLLATRSSALRPLCIGAALLLAVPWIYATSVVSFIAPFSPIAYLAYALGGRNRSIALTAACVAFATIAALFWLSTFYHPHVAAHLHAYPYIDPRLAEASWRAYVLGNSTNNPIMWLLRAPTWCGLTLLALAMLRTAAQGRFVLRAVPAS